MDCYTHGGRNPTELDALDWAKEVVERGAGEILLTVWTVMDKDGYVFPNENNSDAIQFQSCLWRVNPTRMSEESWNNASAVLAASIFHFGEYSIKEAKQTMRDQGVLVRI